MKPVNNTDDVQEVVHLNSSDFLPKLKRKWDEIHLQPDVFRYKINNISRRVVDNKYLLLLNTERNSNRRTPEFVNNVQQPFDPDKFNFNKSSPKEIIFKIQDDNGAVSAFLVNVSPISRFHTLLCPSVNKCLPQVATKDSLELVLKIKFLAKDNDLKIVFNGLCAFASVNHLHYHLLFENNKLYVEIAECTHLRGPVYIIHDNPVPAFCFQVTEQNLFQAAKDINRLIEHLLSKSIGHNIVVVSGQTVVTGSAVDKFEIVRVVVIPRKSATGVKQLTSLNIGACELSGWYLMFNQEQFDKFTATDLENQLSQWKLPNFAELCDEITLLY